MTPRAGSRIDQFAVTTGTCTLKHECVEQQQVSVTDFNQNATKFWTVQAKKKMEFISKCVKRENEKTDLI